LLIFIKEVDLRNLIGPRFEVSKSLPLLKNINRENMELDIRWDLFEIE